ncbi:MAG: hypothetical protein ACI84C_001442 [Flavobacteriales bacterium]|jgi:hypothetical protein
MNIAIYFYSLLAILSTNHHQDIPQEQFSISEQAVSLSNVSGGVANVIINEIDSDNAGLDNMEFIELYGVPDTPLDGLTVVFFNGADDFSYLAIDLDGISTNAEGFALVGNPAVPNVDITFANGALQNGPDAVAVIIGDAIDYPNDTPIDLGVIMDAVVFVTDDLPDPGLMVLLNDGQLVVNESALGNSFAHANARIPDGGIAQNTDTYVQQLPTPGYTNILECDGSELSIVGSIEEVAYVCADILEANVEFSNSSSVDGNYIMVIADAEENILFVETELTVDFFSAAYGSCYAWGLSYTGVLVEGSMAIGEPISGIASDACSSLSINSIEVIKEECNAPTCDAGIVQVQDGSTDAAICVNSDNSVLFFELITDEEFIFFTYALTATDGTIITVFDDEEYDFSDAPEGPCQVWGFAYLGELIEGTLEEGENVADMASDDCFDLTENFVAIQKIECTEDGGCTDLFISEYIEGSSNNKAIEIYNPTPFDINLAPYVLSTYNNGAIMPTNQLNLTGTLASGDVYIIAHSSSSPQILAEADQTAAVTWYNGNDAIVLYNDGELIDIMGVIGEYPDLAFDVNGTSEAMAEYTLVRNVLVTEGSTDWSQGTFQWDVHPLNTFDFIGSHTTVPCNFDETPTISFAEGVAYVLEGNFLNVAVDITFPLIEVIAEVTYLDGTATVGDDYDEIFPLGLTFPIGDGTSQSFTLTTIQDEIPEEQESINIQLTAITEDANVLLGNMTIYILASDLTTPLYEIGQVNQETVEGLADSLTVLCELRGVVHGGNINPLGTQFTLIDGDEGIAVYSFTENFGYDVVEGDSVHVIGSIDQFNGLTQIVPDTILYQASDVALQVPEYVTDLDEYSESRMVQFKCMKLVDPTQWTNEEPGFNVEITNGSSTFELRIDADTDVFGTDVKLGTFNVVGIGGQFDSEIPSDEGYQFIPRYMEDLSESVIAAFDAPTSWLEPDGAISFVNDSENYETVLWEFGDSETSEDENPDHLYDGIGEFIVSLTAFSNEINCSDVTTQTIEIIPVGVEEFTLDNFKLVPNPASTEFFIQGLTSTSLVTVHDNIGRTIIRTSLQSNESINTSDWTIGVYNVSIQSESMTFTKKLIVH